MPSLTIFRFVFLLSLLLLTGPIGCAALQAIASSDGKPLNVVQLEARDQRLDRIGVYYRLAPGEQRPETAMPWVSAEDWEKLDAVEKVDTVEAEQRRGNVILIDGERVYFLPEVNLAKPGKRAPAFVKPVR